MLVRLLLVLIVASSLGAQETLCVICWRTGDGVHCHRLTSWLEIKIFPYNFQECT